MPYYNDDLRVQHKLRHPMTQRDNPFCVRCGFRLMPRWGPHDCGPHIGTEYHRRVRHWAANLHSTLHAYRIDPQMQAQVLATALAYALGMNVRPGVVEAKWQRTAPAIEALIKVVSARVANGTAHENIVMEVSRPRMTVKKRRR